MNRKRRPCGHGAYVDSSASLLALLLEVLVFIAMKVSESFMDMIVDCVVLV